MIKFSRIQIFDELAHSIIFSHYIALFLRPSANQLTSFYMMVKLAVKGLTLIIKPVSYKSKWNSLGDFREIILNTLVSERKYI